MRVKVEREKEKERERERAKGIFASHLVNFPSQHCSLHTLFFLPSSHKQFNAVWHIQGRETLSGLMVRTWKRREKERKRERERERERVNIRFYFPLVHSVHVNSGASAKLSGKLVDKAFCFWQTRSCYSSNNSKYCHCLLIGLAMAYFITRSGSQ